MPVTRGIVELDRWRGFGIEVASAESRLPAANLDEALAMSVKRARVALARNLCRDGLGHRSSLSVSKYTRLGQRKPHREGSGLD